MENWIDRNEALARLGVRAQTLYAYASRKQIEVRRDPDRPRASLYRAEDVEALAAKRGRSRKTAAIAAGSMAWGEPSITTTISTIHRGQLIYRGKDAVALSGSASLEQAAQLLWDCEGEVSFPILSGKSGTPMESLAQLTKTAEATVGRGRERLCREAMIAIGHIAAACGLRPGFPALHLALADCWKLGAVRGDLVRQALILMADHELNPSTFATRVAAATGAPVAASLLAGLCAFSGPIHGGAAAALGRLLEEVSATSPQQAVQSWLDRFGTLPGFGHALYPEGDVRARALTARLTPDPLMGQVQEAVRDMTGLLPNIDFALTMLARTARLPPDAPFIIFLLGRSIGWTAHIIEQSQSRTIIRPRAVYEGQMPKP